MHIHPIRVPIEHTRLSGIDCVAFKLKLMSEKVHTHKFICIHINADCLASSKQINDKPKGAEARRGLHNCWQHNRLVLNKIQKKIRNALIEWHVDWSGEMCIVNGVNTQVSVIVIANVIDCPRARLLYSCKLYWADSFKIEKIFNALYIKNIKRLMP